MLGHVYVVEDAKDLAQIVREVTRYGGAYRPEVCSKNIFFPVSFFFFFDNTGHSFFSKMCMNPFKGDLIEKRLRK